MAEARIVVPEWRDDVGRTRYPFADGASLETTSGQTLDKAAVLDAVLYPAVDSRLFLGRIEAGAESLGLVVVDAGGAAVATATVDPAGVAEVFDLTDAAGRPAGALVVDPAVFGRVRAWPVGTHTFDGTAEFVPGGIVPVPVAGVRSVVLPDGATLTGDVWLVGEDGVVFREVDGAVRMDVVGDPLFRRRLCGGAGLFTAPRVVRSVNGVPIDAYGGFEILVNDQAAYDTVLRIYPDPTTDAVRIELVGKRLADTG